MAAGNPFRRLETEVELPPTPAAYDGMKGGSQHPAKRRAGGHQPSVADVVEHLLPTPCASPSGNTPEEHLRKKPGRERVTDLSILVENDLLATGGKLLPTPVVTDSKDTRNATADRRNPDSKHHSGTTLTDAVTLLPTPRASDPATTSSHASPGFTKPLGQVARESCAGTFGPYAEAIERWEAVTGRKAPAPTELTPKGKHRLSATFVEWLMGQPDGWVTAEELGLSRVQQLRALGNGVVTQQAIYAITWLLERAELNLTESTAA